MQRCVKYKFCSRELWLMYNGAAMFDIYDKYPTLEELFEAVLKNTRESTEKLLDVFLILAENGEAARKYIGYDTDKLPEKAELAALSAADDLGRMRDAVVNAISAGLGREVTHEDEEIDLGLEELEAKKKTHIKLHEYIRAAGMVGLDYRSAMLAAPGLVYDMLDVAYPKRQESGDEF